jgi:hypothetical protein
VPSQSKPHLAIRPPPPVSEGDLDRFATTGEVPSEASPSAPEPGRERPRTPAHGRAPSPEDAPSLHRTGLVKGRHTPLRRRTTFYLTPDTARRCVLLAAEHDVQMSEIAEKALRRYFKWLDRKG